MTHDPIRKRACAIGSRQKSERSAKDKKRPSGKRTVRSGANLKTSDSASNMRRAYSLFPLLLLASSLAASAQSPKPYAPVAIARPAAHADESFAAFRARLAAVAKRRLYAELAPLVEPHGFFWGRDFGQALDPRKPGVDNLAVAVALEQNDGAGWQRLAEFAAEPAAEPLPSRPGVVCAPARPAYDGVAFSKLLETSYTGGVDWAYPRADETPVLAAPKSDAATVGTLGLSFVRLLGFDGAASEPNPGRKQWARVALPDGKIGFAAPGSLMSLTAAQLCYIKDLVAGWRISGYIAGGN